MAWTFQGSLLVRTLRFDYESNVEERYLAARMESEAQKIRSEFLIFEEFWIQVKKYETNSASDPASLQQLTVLPSFRVLKKSRFQLYYHCDLKGGCATQWFFYPDSNIEQNAGEFWQKKALEFSKRLVP